MKKIEELAAVITPPVKPIIRTSDADWLNIFASLGTRLPQDFVQFHKIYGDGWLESLSHPMTANLSVLGDSGGTSFASAAAGHLSHLRVKKENRPTSVPFPLYWEPNGLLPWGRTTNDTVLCWRVRGELVDNWTVVALRTPSHEHEEYDVTMAVFLRRILDRSIESKLMPKGFPGKKGVVFKVNRFGPPPITDDNAATETPFRRPWRFLSKSSEGGRDHP